jgi:hypothetical protein
MYGWDHGKSIMWLGWLTSSFCYMSSFFFLVCACVCARACLLHKYWGLSWVTWYTFHTNTFPQIIWSFFIKEKMLSGFAIAHPRQCRVPLLLYYKFEHPWQKYQIWLQYSSNNLKSVSTSKRFLS